MYFLFNSVVSTTLNISTLDSLIIGGLFYIALLPFIYKKGLKKNILYFLIVLYSSFLFFLTVPIVLHPYPEEIFVKLKWALSEIIWSPLHSIRGISSAVSFAKLIGGNFCLLMPITIFQVIRNKECSWKKVLFTASGISIGIETLQLIGNVIIGYSYRTVELFDVVLNVSGAIVCFLLHKKSKIF